MKSKVLSLAICFLLCNAIPVFSESIEDRVLESRNIISQFADELKNKLQAALMEGGPAQAIDVCSRKAPEVASRFSNQTGWQISRTALKYRNPDNAPQDWEKKVLQKFQNQNKAGQPLKEMEFKELVKINGKKYFRYMKAIGTKEVCLTCHGSKLAPEIEKEIDRLYPLDQAQGFSSGDIRGAFSIVQPIAE